MDYNTIVQLATPIILAVWLFWTERQKSKDKEGVISSAYTREQKRSNQMFDEASEKTALSQVLSSFSDLVKHSIEASNGQVGKLSVVTIDGFKDVTMALLAGFREIAAQQAQQAAAINQLNYFLQERTGQSLVGGNANMLEAAKLRTDAVKRSEDIREAVDASIQADKGDPKVIAIVEAK